jgi:type I restriction enzyme S subunit
VAESVALAIIQLSILERSLLNAAFAGQLVPQDPSDEPTSTLVATLEEETKCRDAGEYADITRRNSSFAPHATQRYDVRGG